MSSSRALPLHMASNWISFDSLKTMSYSIQHASGLIFAAFTLLPL